MVFVLPYLRSREINKYFESFVELYILVYQQGYLQHGMDLFKKAISLSAVILFHLAQTFLSFYLPYVPSVPFTGMKHPP